MFPLSNPRTCRPVLTDLGALPARRVREAATRRNEQRVAKQSERPLQQAQTKVRLPGAVATPTQRLQTRTFHLLGTSLLEMAVPLIYLHFTLGYFRAASE